MKKCLIIWTGKTGVQFFCIEADEKELPAVRYCHGIVLNSPAQIGLEKQCIEWLAHTLKKYKPIPITPGHPFSLGWVEVVVTGDIR